jgi:hypothetical protein
MKQPQLRWAELYLVGLLLSGPQCIYRSHCHSKVCKTRLSSTVPGPKVTNMATNVIPGSLDDDIYLGFWINRSFDTVRGATLTLDRTRGGLLIAFLALFVSTSGRSLWKVARCLLHFTHSSERSSEGIHIQRQAILRNTPLALDAAFELVLVLCAWRRRGAGLLRKLLLPLTVAVFLAVGFIFAGMQRQRDRRRKMTLRANKTLQVYSHLESPAVQQMKFC